MPLDFLQLVGAAGGPSVLALGAVYVLMRRDNRELREDVQDMKKSMRNCKNRREAVEDDLHGRVTTASERVSRLEGRLNGNSR